MPPAQSPFIAPSQDFIALCQSQILLVTQGLQADWSVVYLTEGLEGEAQTKLMPVVAYPSTEAFAEINTQEAALPQGWNRVKTPLALPIARADTWLIPSPAQPSQTKDQGLTIAQNRLVLPLLYQEVMLGLLVTGRSDRPWQPEELAQLDKVAITLAIACLLDRRQKGYWQQLNEQQSLQQQQRDRLDDLFHQLRNPLTALRTFSKLLLKRLHADQKSSTIVEGIVRESDRLQELLKTFEAQQAPRETLPDIVTLDTDSVALLETPSISEPPKLFGDRSMPLTAVAVAEVLKPLLASAEAISQERDIHLTAQIPADLPLIQANELALREVLSNLIDNALKYTNSGGSIQVTVNLLTHLQEIAIEDSGCGIPVEDQPHIFERHYRGIQAQGEIVGSGLGLAIAKDLVEQMQGTIELTSPIRQGRGTHFAIRLPVATIQPIFS